MSKKLLTLMIGLAISLTGSVWAQDTEEEEVTYNQYGVRVDREALHAEQRNNILVLESKSKKYNPSVTVCLSGAHVLPLRHK